MTLLISLHQAFYNEADGNYRIERHVHSVSQWYAVLRGDVECTVGSQVICLSDLDSVLIPPGVVREMRCAGRSPDYVQALFYCEGPVIEGVVPCSTAIPPELRPDLTGLVQELIDQNLDDGLPMVESLLLRLIAGIRRAERSEAKVMANRELVPRLEEYMRSHLHDRLTQASLARAFGVSPSYLARAYKHTTRRTIGRRLTELRIEYAKMLLCDRSLSVTQIALEVGFSSISHFSRIFRQETSFSPSEYRHVAPSPPNLPAMHGNVWHAGQNPAPTFGARILRERHRPKHSGSDTSGSIHTSAKSNDQDKGQARK